MDGRPTWTDCDESGDYVVPNVLSPRDLVFRPDNMDETTHTHWYCKSLFFTKVATELRPLIDVRIWFLLNTLRKNWQNETKLC